MHYHFQMEAFYGVAAAAEGVVPEWSIGVTFTGPVADERPGVGKF